MNEILKAVLIGVVIAAVLFCIFAAIGYKVAGKNKDNKDGK